MSMLLKFGEAVADELGRKNEPVTDTPAAIGDSDVAQAVRYGFDWSILINAAIALAMELIGNCPANDSRVKRSLQNPSRLQTAHLMRKTKEQCECCGLVRFNGDVRKISDAMTNVVAQMPESDLDAMIEEARGFENDPF